MSVSIALILSGFGLGLLHSLEPDHAAAMATLAGRRRSRWADFLDGASWGLGHTLALASFGLLLLNAGELVPNWSERVLEAAAGMLLVGLGLRRLRGAGRGLHHHRRRHGDVDHSHFHPHARGIRHSHDEAHRGHGHAPLGIGLLHGLAGSGAVLVVAPALIVTSPRHYLLYTIAFGVGNVLAMGVFCGALGGTIVRLQRRCRRAAAWLPVASGGLSVGVGGVWLWRLAVL